MTKKISMTRAGRIARLTALGAILGAFLTTEALRAQEPVFCSNATMNGSYVLSGTGTVAGIGAIAVVGKVTYDGQGNAQATQTMSVGGTILRQITSTGTYTVNSDCTGSKTFTGSTGTSHFDFVLAPNGRSITWIVTDSGAVFSGNAVRLDNKD